MAVKVEGKATKRIVKDSESTEPVAAKKGRPVYQPKSGETGPDGKFIALPAGWTSEYRPLKRGQFADETVFIDWQILRLQQNIESLQSQRKRVAAFGDPNTRKMARKAMRARETLAKLEALLAADGVDLSTL